MQVPRIVMLKCICDLIATHIKQVAYADKNQNQEVR